MPDETQRITDLRQEYAQSTLDETAVAADPITQFLAWFGDAQRAGVPEPNAMTHDSRPARSRKFTARSNAERSPHTARTVVSLSFPELSVRTRKIAARVNWATTGCDTGDGGLAFIARSVR